MRIVFLGTGAFGVPALRALRDAGQDIFGVLSQPDRPAGRGREVRATPVRAAARELGLRHDQVEDVNAADQLPLFEHAEIGVVVAFGQKIGPAILSALPRGCINIHASLLPKYRGAAPIQRAVLSGDAATGVTVFQINERWDAGAVWATRSTPIGETETADELHDRLSLIGAELIVETIAGIASGALRPQPQDPAQATRAPKLSKSEGTVDWSQPAPAVVRRIHGLWSWPAAACLFVSRRGRQERVLLARAAVTDADGLPSAIAAPGAFRSDRTVQTGRGTVRLLEIQPAGGRCMDFEAFANGRQVAPPDRLERIDL